MRGFHNRRDVEDNHRSMQRREETPKFQNEEKYQRGRYPEREMQRIGSGRNEEENQRDKEGKRRFFLFQYKLLGVLFFNSFSF